MSTLRKLFLLAGAAGASLPAAPAAAGGPNVAVCMALANSYNACIVSEQRRGRDWRDGGWDGPGYDGGYGGGGYGGGGYGGGGYGRDWDDDPDYWRQQRRAARANRAQAACMTWLVQMKAANCY